MSDVSGVSNSLTNAVSSYIDNPSSALGKTDFLEMLVTKLKFQDPLNPVDDESFVADMAQFSSLESMTNLNETFAQQMSDLNTNIVSLMLMQNTTQAAGLIGKTVTIDQGGTLSDVTGTVEAVRFVEGQPKLVVDGVEYGLAGVTEISV